MLYIIGIGVKGRESLSPGSLKLIERAGLLIGGARHLEGFPGVKGRKVRIRADLESVARTIGDYIKRGRKSPAVVLATGDPGLFGIADFFVKRLGKKSVRIAPNVSPVQEAFARIKENWNGAKVLSVHGRGGGRGGARGGGLEGVVSEIIGTERTAVFTDPVNTPRKIARALVDRGINGYSVYVCEALGTKEEKIRKGTLKTVARGSYNPLNVMVLIRDKGSSRASYPLFGIPDKGFSRSRELITKEEIRVIALSKLRLGPDSVVWDIGAGSGSVAVEAARLATAGVVYAVERGKKRVRDIEENRRRFGVRNLKIVCGTAPGCLSVGSLTRPDRVFIGGGGTGLPGILNYVARRITRGGIVVINAVTIDTLSKATGFFKRRRWQWDVVSINLSRRRPVGGLDLLSANNSVFIISAVKP
jgi:precorrin-6Y C5,15-methyltransferase (decarboxylating)